ncbi:MAG TPA: NADPH-dependent F420 reductase [Pseudonocardiaceae bacterium]|nr:NADPH-dependent F420 reductase [Pseudonocardiaceae bacterium]
MIGILGGTGPEGSGLALRWAAAGLQVVIGSRDAGRAETVARDLARRAGLDAGSDAVSGADNVGCAARADVVLVTVPWEGHDALLESLREPLAGKIVVDCVNPLGFDERGPYPLQITDGSAAQRAAALLPDSRVIAAFHHVSAVILADLSIIQVDCDVLVLGDDRAAVDQVRALADAIPGVRGVYGGRLRNAGQVEALAANLIAVNRRYRTHAGIRLTGVRP